MLNRGKKVPKAIICLILMILFMPSGNILALQNSCQHGIIIKFIPHSKAEIDEKINFIEIKSPDAFLAPNNINENRIPLNLYRRETSGYFGKITAELNKDYGFGMDFIVSCDKITKTDRKWKKIVTSAINILSGIRNDGNMKSSISYGLSKPDPKNLSNDKMITVILTIIDDEQIDNQEMLPREFYSYEEFYKSIEIYPQKFPFSVTRQ